MQGKLNNMLKLHDLLMTNPGRGRKLIIKNVGQCVGCNTTRRVPNIL